MTDQHPLLPPGIEADDEIAIAIAREEDGSTQITATLGGASLSVKTDDDSIELVPWLVAAGPQIIAAAFEELERQEQEADEADGEDQQ